MHRTTGSVWQQLAGLMPGELTRAEVSWLVAPYRHSPLLTRRLATMLVNRVRLLAFLFAILTPLWSLIDFLVFPLAVWADLGLMRIVASVAFASLLLEFKPDGNLKSAYRAVALLFAIPTLFDVFSHYLMASHHLAGTSMAVAAGYTFLPFVLLAGLSIFPFTLLETLIVAMPILLLQAASAYVRWPTAGWESFAGALWLLVLITGISALAGMSQLVFMLALFRQAMRDPLTGALSRKSGEEILDLQFSIARRSNKPLSLAFIDLDRFKSVNDRFGHDAGDRVLTGFTRTLAGKLRHGDMLVRWGGEEFLLILPNTHIEEAESALMRLRQAGFGLRPDDTPQTASMGIAERLAMQAEDWKALVAKADERMYRAKMEGRDRIVCRDGASMESGAELAAG